ncbi:DNA-binding protein [Lysobacter gummosus]|uniref:DNA-binding protein n=1 Tax=Lysobacter gummosus TaxID=262324 RepID=UPI00362AB122
MSNRSRIRTPEQAKAVLLRQGISMAQFARDNGLTTAAVYHALYGTTKGNRGESHRAAVALGLKRGAVAGKR